MANLVKPLYLLRERKKRESKEERVKRRWM